MIPNGLKVGDTYLEGNLVYKITEVVDQEQGIYAGVWTGETSSISSVEPATEVEEEKEDYLSMPYAQLKKLCAERGLNAIGSKSDLIARLEG